MGKTPPDSAVMLAAASIAIEFVTQAESWPVFYEFLTAKGYNVPGESIEAEVELWGTRAVSLLQQAVDEAIDGYDPLPTLLSLIHI